MTYPVKYTVMNGGLLRQSGFKYTFTNFNNAAEFQFKHVNFRSCTLYWLDQSAGLKSALACTDRR